jgi:hypothetical protein
MWIVELNILGHRFTHYVPDRRRSLTFHRPRLTRLASLRDPRAA